jgi:hypothetical protein
MFYKVFYAVVFLVWCGSQACNFEYPCGSWHILRNFVRIHTMPSKLC